MRLKLAIAVLAHYAIGRRHEAGFSDEIETFSEEPESIDPVESPRGWLL